MQGYGTTEAHPLLVRIQNSTATLEQLRSLLKSKHSLNHMIQQYLPKVK